MKRLAIVAAVLLFTTSSWCCVAIPNPFRGPQTTASVVPPTVDTTRFQD